MKTIIIAVSLFMVSSLSAQTELAKKIGSSAPPSSKTSEGLCKATECRMECAKPDTEMVCGQLTILLRIIKEDVRLEKIKDNSVSERYVKTLMEYYNCEE